jgi:hypothetical protein
MPKSVDKYLLSEEEYQQRKRKQKRSPRRPSKKAKSPMARRKQIKSPMARRKQIKSPRRPRRPSKSPMASPRRRPKRTTKSKKRQASPMASPRRPRRTTKSPMASPRRPRRTTKSKEAKSPKRPVKNTMLPVIGAKSVKYSVIPNFTRKAPAIKASSVGALDIVFGIDQKWWQSTAKSNGSFYWKRLGDPCIPTHFILFTGSKMSKYYALFGRLVE